MTYELTSMKSSLQNSNIKFQCKTTTKTFRWFLVFVTIITSLKTLLRLSSKHIVLIHKALLNLLSRCRKLCKFVNIVIDLNVFWPLNQVSSEFDLFRRLQFLVWRESLNRYLVKTNIIQNRDCISSNGQL